MAAEVLEHGTLQVRRPNREHLMAIRRGEFEYETLMAQAEDKLLEIDRLFAKSSLPELPDKSKIERLLISVRVDWYRPV